MSTDCETHPPTDDSVRRIAAALRTALRLAGLSNRACERELGLSTGYLTRILDGEVHLRVCVVLDLCRMLDLPPAALFMALFPPPQLPATTTRLLRGLSAVHPQTAPSTSPDALFETTLEIREAVMRIEGYLSATEPPPAG